MEGQAGLTSIVFGIRTASARRTKAVRGRERLPRAPTRTTAPSAPSSMQARIASFLSPSSALSCAWVGALEMMGLETVKSVTIAPSAGVSASPRALALRWDWWRHGGAERWGCTCWWR